jgi:hypothetical protein
VPDEHARDQARIVADAAPRLDDGTRSDEAARADARLPPMETCAPISRADPARQAPRSRSDDAGRERRLGMQQRRDAGVGGMRIARRSARHRRARRRLRIEDDAPARVPLSCSTYLDWRGT